VSAFRDFLIAPPAGASRGADDRDGTVRPATRGIAGARDRDGAVRPVTARGGAGAEERDRAVGPAAVQGMAGGRLRRAARLLVGAPRMPAAAGVAVVGAGERPAEIDAIAAGAVSASVPAAVAVVCAADDARALGVATAGLLARRGRAPCALVCIWTAAGGRDRSDARPRSRRAARRLTAALAARGLDAHACGRAAVVALPAEPDEALTAAIRAGAAAGAAATVLVLGGPRPVAFDDLLAAQDRVLVISRPAVDAAIGALALAGLPADGPSLHATVGMGALGRSAAAAGLATPAALRRALDDLDAAGA
jgi:hypothetical protein